MTAMNKSPNIMSIIMNINPQIQVLLFAETLITPSSRFAYIILIKKWIIFKKLKTHLTFYIDYNNWLNF